MNNAFNWIRWQNLLSTGQSWNRVDLNKDPTTLIVGLNGHGKSTLLDALTLALFNKPFRNVNKPDLINSINGRECVVELSFNIGTKSYRVVRGMKPNIFEIHMNGESLDQTAAGGDFQKYLEESILKFNYKSFTQIAILGSKSFTPFMKLNAGERRAIIENLLDLEIFSDMNKIAKDKFKKAKESYAANKVALENTKQKLELQQRYIAEAKKNNQEIIDSIEANKAQQELELNECSSNELALKDAIAKIVDSIKDKGDIESQLQSMEGIRVKIQLKLNKATQEVKFYGQNDNCPTCRQVIAPEFKTAEIEKAQVVIGSMEENMVKFNQQKAELSARNEQLKALNDEYHRLKMQLNTVQSTCSRLKKSIAAADVEIARLKSKKSLSDDLLKVADQLAQEMTDLEGASNLLFEDKLYYEESIALLDDGGIKAQYIKQYLPIINSLINKYLSAMDFYVNFHLDEEFNETIKSRHRDEFKYENFSDGERQKIDLALLLAWRDVAKLKNSLNTNLLIMDEIFDSSLDGVGADLVMSILSTIPEGSNVFVISHREALQERFAHTIKFEKKNNFSQVVEND